MGMVVLSAAFLRFSAAIEKIIEKEGFCTMRKALLGVVEMENERTRTFDDGKLSVRFASAEKAKSFDNYLNSTFTIVYGGKKIESFKVKDNFNPYEFFNVSEKIS